MQYEILQLREVVRTSKIHPDLTVGPLAIFPVVYKNT
jgi:hypothetical protein